MQQVMQQTRKRFLTQDEIRTILNLTKRQLWDLHDTGKGPKYYWINQNTKRYDPDEFDAWLKARHCSNSSQEYLIKEEYKKQFKGERHDDASK